MATNTYSFNSVDSAFTNNVVCSASNTVIVNPTLISTSWSASNTVVNQGQWETLNAVISGGTAPYTYNYLAYNPTIGGLCRNQIYISSATSNTYTFQTGLCGTGTITANIIIKNKTGETVSNTLQKTANPTLYVGTPLVSNNLIDVGESSILTANFSGGSPGFTYQWYSVDGVLPPTCNVANIIGGATSNTYTAFPITTTTYSVKVSDSASTSEGWCSAPTLLTVVLGNSIPASSTSAIATAENRTNLYVSSGMKY